MCWIKKMSHQTKRKSNSISLSGIFVTIALLFVYRMSSDAQETYDYVIITTNAIDTFTVGDGTILDSFIVQKQNMGFSVRTVTETLERAGIGPRISTNCGYGTEDSTQRVENIRNWLKIHYRDYKIKYVLLVGDPHPWVKGHYDSVHQSNPMNDVLGPLRGGEFSIPMKMCYRDTTDSYTSATDYYYAELTGNWNRDSDSLWGEFYHDFSWSMHDTVMDLFPEVFVGRIPVYSEDYLDDLSYILQKTITFENKTENIGYRRKYLMAFSHAEWENAEFAEHLELDYGTLWGPIFKQPFETAGFDIFTMYQQEAGTFCDCAVESDSDLTDGALVRHWKNNPYGMVFYLSHGNPTHGELGCNKGNIIDTADVDSLQDSLPAFAIQGGCFNGCPYYPNIFIDEDEGKNHQIIENLHYKMLRNGSVANIAWTTGGYTDMVDMLNDYQKRVVLDFMPIGDAIHLAKATNVTENIEQYKNLLHMTLYGDPSLSLMPVGEAVNVKVTKTGLKRTRITWHDKCSNEHHFSIYRKTADDTGWIYIGQASGNEVTYIDSVGLEGNAEYFYRVAALDSTSDTLGISNTAAIFTGAVVDFKPVYIRQCLTADNQAVVGFANKSYTDIGQITGYTWNFGDTSMSHSLEPLHVYDRPGHFTVTLTVKSQDDYDTCNNTKAVQGCVYVENSDNFIGSFVCLNPPTPSEDYTGLWIRDMKNSGPFTIKSDWARVPQLQQTPDMLAAGDLDGDGYDEIVGRWWDPHGIWVYDYNNGNPNWTNIFPDFNRLIWMAVGDINGGGKDDFIWSDNTQENRGVWVRYSEGDTVQLHAEPAEMIAAGDINADGNDDLVGRWVKYGIWVRYGGNNWQKILDSADAATIQYLTCGDLDGDHYDDIIISHDPLGTWVYYGGNVADKWKKLDERIASPIAAGNFDDDGKDDLYLVWRDLQGNDYHKGVWVWSSYWAGFNESRQKLVPYEPMAITVGNFYPQPE